MAASGRLSVGDGRRRRVGALAGLALAAGSLHMALLGGLRWTWDAPTALATPAPPMRIRAVVAAVEPAAPAAVAEVLPAAPAAIAVARAAEPAARDRLPAVARRTGAPKSAGVVPQPAAPTPVAAGPALAEPNEDEPPPIYRTRLPPPVTLRYAVRRGAASGAADLRWRRDADGYALDWQIRIGDVAVLTQSSRGGIDGAGIAPLRFVDERPSRSAAAVNFQRDIGRIGFSRKAADAPLVPGAQDRLSWLLQLAAVVAAEPALRRDGADVRITVVGAGGDVAVWRFRCEGEEAVETSAGATPSLRFVREPRGPYETRAEVWLDPAGGHYLPLRANWRSGAADEGFELRRRDTVEGVQE